MVRQALAVCAESVVRDVETNVVSIFNIFEEINAPGFPIVLPKASILFFLERQAKDPQKYDTVLHVRLDDNEIARLPVRVDFQHSLINRHIVVMQGLQIPGPGRLRATLTIGDQELNGWEIIVKQVPSTAGMDMSRMQ